MPSGYSIFSYMRVAPAPAWRDIGMLFLFIAVGALFPVFASPVLLIVWSENVQWSQFATHAEFTLYTASILMSAMFLVVRDYKKDPFPNQAMLVLLFVLLLLFATLVFAGVAGRSQGGKSFNERFVIWSSLLAFLFSVVVAFFVTLVDNVRTGFDIRKLQKLQKTQQEQLKAEFEATGDKDA